jgi:hypothetical protein
LETSEPDTQEPIPPASLRTPIERIPTASKNPEGTPDDEQRDSAPNDEQCVLPNQRRDEVSAEVPKLGVSGESHRATDLETPTFDKNKE